MGICLGGGKIVFGVPISDPYGVWRRAFLRLKGRAWNSGGCVGAAVRVVWVEGATVGVVGEIVRYAIASVWVEVDFMLVAIGVVCSGVGFAKTAVRNVCGWVAGVGECIA